MLTTKRHLDDFSRLKKSELLDFQSFHKKIKEHLLASGLTYDDGKPVNQFLTMFRESSDIHDPSYYKMNHLHIHIVPDKRGVDRFKLDPDAVKIAIESLKL